MAYSKQKNLIRNKTEYSKYYGEFRGVDFSSDHTRVHDRRFSYAVNVYKDYQSAQGHAIETIPGFRTRYKLSETIYGIHRFKYRNPDNKNIIEQHVIIHHGNSLSRFFPDTDALINLTMPEGMAMNTQKSTSFVFNNRLWILDGANYVFYDGQNIYSADDENYAYIPTTEISIEIGGTGLGTEYEQRNLLSPFFYREYIFRDYNAEISVSGSDERRKVIRLNDIHNKPVSVKIGNATLALDSSKYEEELERLESDYTGAFTTRYDINSIPTGDLYILYDKIKADTIITIKYENPVKKVTGVTDKSLVDEAAHSIILGCSIHAVYDNRVFFSGNPQYPNHVFFCHRNSTGYTDPTYFGELNHFQEGVGNSPVTAMMPVADTLVVLKSDTQQDGSIYYHKPLIMDNDVIPVTYPSEPGLNGTGCLGACVNFLDDPIFISRFGVEGIGQLSVRYERAIEHRSSLIDAKLLNLSGEKLKNACLEEWGGYLCLLVDGKIFLADSRQRYTHESGIMQYEWYYLEDIGVYEGQYPEYVYSRELPEVIAKLTSPPSIKLDGGVVNESANVTVEFAEYGEEGQAYPFVTLNGIRYLCEETGAKIGGVFSPAIVIREIDGNLFFGTENGTLCSFNFDKRNAFFEIPSEWYDFNGRTIFSACATKMDCCDIPHLTKSTVNRSTVIKTKELLRSGAKIAVRTNKIPFKQISRINSSVFNLSDLDFGDFTTEQTLYSISEKERKWVEKQYYIYSDEFKRPFALFYIAYRYTICGRIKT